MIMVGEHKAFQEHEVKKQNRKHEEMWRRERERENKNTCSLVTSDDDNSSINTAEDGEIPEDDDEADVSTYHRRRISSVTSPGVSGINTPKVTKINKRCLIDNQLFVASLDRTKTTPREAMHIVDPVLLAIGINVDDLTLSTTSFYEARKEVRKEIVERV